MSDAYANRTDLNNAINKIPRQAATNQTYGKATEQLEAQRAVPMGSSPVDVSPVQRPVPGTLGGLSRRTERPDEPITAGAPFGSGMGPEAMGLAGNSNNAALEELRMIFQMFPNDDLADLIDSYYEGA
jgi:hypothetical protein